ncbi:MAG: class I SAM-dependent methyltransferase [Thermoanaerobaculum sp.]|nr:class I SAM-dependent methyltransferase [Thermoanaerobaculum sp.]
MRRLPKPIPREELLPLLHDVPEGVFTPVFTQACEVVDLFVGDCLAHLVHELALGGFSGSPEDLAHQRGYSAHKTPMLHLLLDCLELYGLARCDDKTYEVALPAGQEPFPQRYHHWVSVAPTAEPALAVQRLGAEVFPRVLSGELSGEEALFSLAHLDLWFSYFSNANVHYAPTNSLAALALSRSVGKHARILELGGGGGSAAEAAFASLLATDQAPALYVFTEVHPAFLRRGGRLVRQLAPPSCRLEIRPYDINLTPEEQGFSPQEFDAVFAVNVLHLAAHLVEALTQLRRLLVPGGALVLGELIRPCFSAPVHLELPFALLQSYQQVQLAPRVRTRPGFLCLQGWQNALHEAGFSEVHVLPAALQECFAHYPGFYCAALVAR